MFSTLIPRLTKFRALGVSIWRHPRRFAVVSIGILGLSSCAVSPIGDGTAGATGATAPRDVVASRVRARWDALIKGDVAGSYAFLSPAARATVSLAQYEGKTRKGGFREARIDSIDCDATACTVKLWITYDHPMMKGITTPLQESWVIENGQAWYVYRG
jgi:hypothetical protein